MADFFSNLFDAIAYIPNKLGEWSYNAGLPNELATAYASKKLANLKEQYIAAELLKAQDEARLRKPKLDAIDRYQKLLKNENTSFDQGFSDKYNKGKSFDYFLNSKENVPFKQNGASSVLDMFEPIKTNSSLLQKPITDLFGPAKTNDKLMTFDNGTKIIPVTEQKVVSNPGREYKGLSNIVTEGQNPDLNGDPTTAKAAEELHDILAQNGINATVNSFFRDPDRNARVGGSPTSYHLQGTAVDWDIPDDAQRAKAKEIAKQLGFSEVLDEGDHLHTGGFNGSLSGGGNTSVQNITKNTQVPMKDVQYVPGKDLATDYNFSNLLTDKRLLKYRTPITEQELAMSVPEAYFAAGYTPDEVKYMSMNNDQRQLSGLIKNDLAQSADQKARLAETVRNNMGDLASKLQDMVRKQYETNVEYGANSDMIAQAQNQVDSIGSIYGIPAGTFRVNTSQEPGTKRVKLSVDIANIENQIQNRNANTNINARNSDIKAAVAESTIKKNNASIQKTLTQLSKLQKGEELDPTEMDRNRKLYSDGSEGLLDKMAGMNPVDRQMFFNNNAKLIYAAGMVSGKSEQQIRNDLLALGVIRERPVDSQGSFSD